MSNRYGITLDSAWTEWAAKQEVSETVAAALYLICETGRPQEVVGKLTEGEFENVVDIVRRWPDHFPPGTLAALKNRGPRPACRPQSDSVSTDQSPRQSTKPQSGKECGIIGNPFGIALDQALLGWAAAEGVTETVIAAVSLLHQRSVEEIAGKLTPAELADVTRLVSRCPSCYPPGAYDALKAKRNLASPAPPTQNLPSTLAAKEQTAPTKAFHLLPAFSCYFVGVDLRLDRNSGWTRLTRWASNDFHEDAPRHHHARRPAPRDAVALAQLRAVLASRKSRSGVLRQPRQIGVFACRARR